VVVVERDLSIGRELIVFEAGALRELPM